MKFIAKIRQRCKFSCSRFRPRQQEKTLCRLANIWYPDGTVKVGVLSHESFNDEKNSSADGSDLSHRAVVRPSAPKTGGTTMVKPKQTISPRDIDKLPFSVSDRSSTRDPRSLRTSPPSPEDIIQALSGAYENQRARQVGEWESRQATRIRLFA